MSARSVSNGTGSPLSDVCHSIPAALRRATAEGVFALPGSSLDLESKPCGVFYDLDAFDANADSCARAFGAGFLHAVAFKSNGLPGLMRGLLAKGFGAECASMGEVLHAERLGFAGDAIIFDSPVKTVAEIRYALEKGIHLNIDSLAELEVVAEQVAAVGARGPVGCRVNPLVGAGQIKALSVSTEDSKFGIPISERPALLAAYLEHPWLTSVHVHVGSGGMGSQVLVEGIAVAVGFAAEVNAQAGTAQVQYLDMGGGCPVNYSGESWTSEKVPSWDEYASALRARVPQLFDGTFKRVVTEFGQSLNAKPGWLASRIEYVKPLGKEQCCLIHFGADSCVRQLYTNEHQRRIEFYTATGDKAEAGSVPTTVAGPLCFAGDVFARGLQAPPLRRGDIVVLRDAGSNTLSLFSRHCLRQAPAAYGYRTRNGEVTDWQTLRAIEPLAGGSEYWFPKEQDAAASSAKTWGLPAEGPTFHASYPTEFRPSLIEGAGQGWFSTVDVPAGTRLRRVSVADGSLVKFRSAQDLLDRGWDIDDAVNYGIGHHADPTAIYFLNPGTAVNHADRSRVASIRYRHDEAGVLEVWTVRDVKAGEEMLCDYAQDYGPCKWYDEMQVARGNVPLSQLPKSIEAMYACGMN